MKQHGFSIIDCLIAITALVAICLGCFVLFTLAHFIHKFW